MTSIPFDPVVMSAIFPSEAPGPWRDPPLAEDLAGPIVPAYDRIQWGTSVGGVSSD
jgi:hypothetical protein